MTGSQLKTLREKIRPAKSQGYCMTFVYTADSSKFVQSQQDSCAFDQDVRQLYPGLCFSVIGAVQPIIFIFKTMQCSAFTQE